MGDMLSQDEIDALLGGGVSNSTEPEPEPSLDDTNDENIGNLLSTEEKDILGEIGNISMGTSATTLYALLNQKVTITTPKVNIIKFSSLSEKYDRPCVGIRVDYKEGIVGSNILILRQRDVKVIANLMMGGTGEIEDDELTEIDLSAIAEAMNQMIGSSSTSLSSMLEHKIDIDTPQAFVLSFDDDTFFDKLGLKDEVVACVSFRMEIGSLIDSEIMQILPIEFALQMVNKLKSSMMGGASEAESAATQTTSAQSEPKAEQSQAGYMDQAYTPQTEYGAMGGQPQQPIGYGQPQQQMGYNQPQQPMGYNQPMYDQSMMQQQMGGYNQPMYGQPMGYNQPMYNQPMGYQPQMQPPPQPQQTQSVQPVQFQNFDVSEVMQQKENIGIIMDVPLEITVELGRTNKKIKEILEFSPGTVVELDKLAGEPIDILVNGKFIAKGEVVVIDENFGIRITDIISKENRI